MKKKFLLIPCFHLLMLFISSAQVTYFKGLLQGSQEVPANASTAVGTVIVKYNAGTKILDLIGDYQNMTAASTASHIHNAAVGVSGPVIFSLTTSGGTTGTITGSAITLTLAQETELFAGRYYVNVHNATFPGGEIRAQLTAATTNNTTFLTGNLRGNQEVPTNASAGSGRVTVLLDNGTGTVYLTGNFSGLVSTATASHIHQAAAGSNGAVFFALGLSGTTSGTITGSSAISTTNATQMMAGNTYVNVHSSTLPGGEIRAQLVHTGFDQFRVFTGTLQGTQEVPPSGSAAIGTVIVKYNTSDRQLQLVGDYQNMSSAVTASHIHVGPTGISGGVIVNVTNTGGISGILSTTQTLTDIQETDLFAGQTYTNVHSSSFPGGEIRAQLNPTTDGQTNYFTGTLQGSQEVPANASAGTGTVTTVLDRATGFVYVTGNFSGLSGTVTASHIHVAPPGTNGSVVLGLTPTTSVTTGSTTGSGAMTPTNQTQMLAGNSYINVHTTAFPGGEIRAQLGSIALPAKLVYFNGFRNNEEATLVWKTSQELDFSRFEIQRLLPGNVWSTRGAVTANGGASEYRFNDKPNGNNTIAIYRLKMIDKDGEASFSRIITISFGKQTALLSIVENPVKNSVLQFQVTGLKSQESLTVKIMDINGRIVHNETTSSINMNTISIHELSAGVYKLVVHTRDGLLQKTFIKL